MSIFTVGEFEIRNWMCNAKMMFHIYGSLTAILLPITSSATSHSSISPLSLDTANQPTRALPTQSGFAPGGAGKLERSANT